MNNQHEISNEQLKGHTLKHPVMQSPLQTVEKKLCILVSR